MAGDPISGLALVIPAFKVFDDIEVRLGVRPALPVPSTRSSFRPVRTDVGKECSFNQHARKKFVATGEETSLRGVAHLSANERHQQRGTLLGISPPGPSPSRENVPNVDSPIIDASGTSSIATSSVLSMSSGRRSYATSTAATEDSIPLVGDAHSYEALDPRFRVSDDHWEFFVPGRVFQMLDWEPEGYSRTTGSNQCNVRRFGETAFAKVYRYVVVRARPRQGYSVCLRISTYAGRGTARIPTAQSEHSIIYTGDSPPEKLWEEKKLLKDPIRVIPVGDRELDARARVNYAKSYPIEHNVKVLEIGRVDPKNIKRLTTHWIQETEKGFPPKGSDRKSGRRHASRKA